MYLVHPWAVACCEHVTSYVILLLLSHIPDSKVHGANMGPIWDRQDPGGPHVGSMNFAIWDYTIFLLLLCHDNFIVNYSYLLFQSILDPLYQHGLTSTPALISNYIRFKVWDEMTYPFLNFNSATLKFGNG